MYEVRVCAERKLQALFARRSFVLFFSRNLLVLAEMYSFTSLESDLFQVNLLYAWSLYRNASGTLLAAEGVA